jgi:hypothetical protein
VLDELMCDLSVPIRISCLFDQILEVKESHYKERHPSFGGGYNRGISSVLGSGI